MNTMGCCSFALLGMLASGVCAGHEARAQGRSTSFTPACAGRDTQALGAIEQFGDVSEMPVEWLRDAGMSWLEARRLCLNGDEAGGIALYDRIVAGAVRLSTSLSVKLGIK